MIAIYIDVQNVHIATQNLGWMIDWQKLYIYLKHHYHADTIYYVVGYISSLQSLYTEIENFGYAMIFKETGYHNSTIKGNVDIDIAITAMFDLWKNNLSKAYLMSNDGDYNTLLRVRQQEHVFGGLICPDAQSASRMTKKIAKDFVDLQRIKHLIKKP